MLRPLPALILVAAILSIAGLASGFAPGGATHGRVGLLAVGAMVAADGLAVARVRAVGRRVEAVAMASGLPEWVRGQAEKNRAKATIYLGAGLGLAGLAGWSGWLGGGGMHPGASASMVAFQLSASTPLILVVTTQSRLLRDVEMWADPARAGSLKP